MSRAPFPSPLSSDLTRLRGMFSTQDTIVAIATPAGRGGIGVVRQRVGRVRIASALLKPDGSQPRARHIRAHARRPGRRHILPSPHSYTGEDVVVARTAAWSSCADSHQAMESGARLAEPGEFTLRAFLNGRIDLIQAKRSPSIDAVTPLQRAAFDQLEGVTERITRIDGSTARG